MSLSNLKHVPQIMAVMTPFPYSIGIDEPIVKAHEMMAGQDIRHLPVKDHGDLVGVISERDVRVATEKGAVATAGGTLRVRDVYLPEAYVVDVSERLDSVLLHMARHHIGSALVVKEDRLAGIFTNTDACRLLGVWLRERFPVSPDNGHAAA